VAASVLVWLMLAAPAATLARAGATKDDDKPKPDAVKKTEPLKDKENPELIGKRDINKGSIDFYSNSKEVALGRQLAAEIDRQAKFITDPVIGEYVNRLGQNIVLHSDANIPFTIKIIDSPDVNAFALPGGFLYVNSGLLLAADNESEVAGVMAHEIAHVAARHGVEQASKGRLFQYLSIPLIFVGGPVGMIAQNAVNILVPMSFLKFSRGAEEEADRLGLQYMWAAGYDPTSMLSFFEKLKAREKKKPGTLEKLFSTHPATGDRIQKAQSLLVRFPERDEYMISTSEFAGVKAKLLALTTQAKLGPDGSPTLRRKPTLKRTDPDAPDAEPRDKPTLKRKSGSDN
ncbi:MAG TPA: M48 family metallopeptidase, partial [Blastocatellia bacterium]|nr:M48 family metallopeptidase [Blastocatellia bacterium]